MWGICVLWLFTYFSFSNRRENCSNMPNLGSKLSLIDDTVNCFYFTTKDGTESGYWETLCTAINTSIDRLSSNYLWHKDNFKVFLPIFENKLDGVPKHLCSCTSFGDNVEDEWFIVYLIYKLTRQFPDLIVQVQDNDGHFLLIEAADCLPKWMNPDNTENRVFIYKGDIHILPPSLRDLDKELSVKEAIDIINHAQETKAAPEIQRAIHKMISAYPEKIKENMHKALIKLPLELAAVLKLEPGLISHIVNAYCNHDVIDAKCCKNISFEKDYVCMQINFTKCLYAMLSHSKLPSSAMEQRLKNDKKATLGLKLVYGYKIIMNEPSDFLSTKDYRRYLNNLKENGYFKDNLEGSKDYTLLIEKANEYYSSLLCPINKNECKRIQELISTEGFKKQVQCLTNCDESSFGEDSEEWLNINPEQLNDLLLSRYGQQARFKNDVTPQGMTSQVTSFLHQISDFEGIELNRENNQDNDEIEFDVDIFSESLKKILNFIAPENGESVALEDEFSSSSNDEEVDTNEDDATTALDKELRETLASDIIKQNPSENKKFIYDSFMQGVKEEGPAGPTSNLLNSIAKDKHYILDSDDDCE